MQPAECTDSIAPLNDATSFRSARSRRSVLSCLSCRANVTRASRLISTLAIAAAFLALASNAQNPMAPSTPTATQPAPPATPNAAAPAPSNPTASPSQPPATNDAPPTFSSPPVAIVPLDKSIPGAALSVDGRLQAWNGRAYLTGSGTITAGDATAQVTLPYRGTMHVCASSAVKLATDSSSASGAASSTASGGAPGDVPGLLIALDQGAVEMSFAASTARAQNADTLLTPYFRILIGGPNAADVRVRLGDNGDTCVDNAGANAPYVVVTSVFEGGLYRVQPGQRVMFQQGSLQKVVDEEKEPCGCPSPTKSQANEFPLAQSEGLAPIPPSPPAPVANQTAGSGQATTTLVYQSTAVAPQPVATPQPPAASPAATGPPTPAPGAEKKPGFFSRVGHFFKRMIGAE
jgi:hypothetical protein